MYFIHAKQPLDASPCPHCGMTLQGFTTSGRVGCAGCYAHFKTRITPYIRRIHGPAAHTGHIPASAGEALREKRRLSELKARLQRAIESQDFETCARLRDEIRSLDAADAGKEATS